MDLIPSIPETFLFKTMNDEDQSIFKAVWLDFKTYIPVVFTELYIYTLNNAYKPHI